MRKIIVAEFVSLDGVIKTPRKPGDRRDVYLIFSARKPGNVPSVPELSLSPSFPDLTDQQVKILIFMRRGSALAARRSQQVRSPRHRPGLI